MVLYLHKAAKKLGIHPKLLKADIKNGDLHLNDDGCVDCEELKSLYPMQWARAMQDNALDYYEAVKATAGNWKNGARESAQKKEKRELVNTIRKLEAECYALNKRVLELEAKLAEKH